jgi:hypothetical protein
VKCDICNGFFEGKANSRISIDTPKKNESYVVCDICAAAVGEFILEFRLDIQNQNWKELGKPKRDPIRQKRLEVEME